MRLGIDVGGTKIEGALVNDNGQIIDSIRKPTEADKGKKQVLKNILFVIQALNSDDVKSIGIGLPGTIGEDGKLLFATHISCINGLNVAKEIEKNIGKKVKQENDANCFALAERRFGAAKGYRNVVGVILGTGIGAGVIINSELYKGFSGSAGEFGFMRFSEKESFEQICSGIGIVKRYKEKRGRIENPDPANIFASGELIAREVVEETYNYLGRFFVNIICAVNPEIIVLGGGLSNLPMTGRIVQELKKYPFPVLLKNVNIVKNKLGDSSGVIGAAFL
ncbi:MAG: ROK family protein [archaeon]